MRFLGHDPIIDLATVVRRLLSERGSGGGGGFKGRHRGVTSVITCLVQSHNLLGYETRAGGGEEGLRGGTVASGFSSLPPAGVPPVPGRFFFITLEPRVE